VLVECGYTRATTSDGSEWTFAPSFGRLATLGSPREIVALYAALHGQHAAREARYILSVLCEQDDPLPLLGWLDEAGEHRGAMPEAEQIILAQHLMRHGVAGTARPGQDGGQYSDSFDAGEYIAAARVHLGLPSVEAEALSMTEFQMLMEVKFPDSAKRRDVPTREEYDEAMQVFHMRRRDG
jgi:hypothetical protein